MPTRRALVRGALSLPPMALATAAPRANGAGILRIGTATPATTFDPHFHAHAPSHALHRHVFEGLLVRRSDLRLRPGLARAWAPLPSGEGWEFHMDPAARFHDGTPVTAADAAASIRRVATVPASPSRWTPFIAEVERAEAVDPLTLRLHTRGPAPLLPGSLPAILIVPERIALHATTAAFNAGSAAIGSGPFRLRSFAPRDLIELDADPGWWQRDRGVIPAPAFARAAFRPVPADPVRLAALLAGDLDLIEALPTADLARLQARRGFAVARAPSMRFVYLALDQGRDESPGLADLQGRALARNPLKDVRVRRALSLAINRGAIVAQVMDGQATPTGQMLPDDLPSAVPNLPPDRFDPLAARRLLEEAGWAEGFRLRLATSNDRLPNDEKVAQAVAQMWGRIGVRTEVDALPAAVYAGRFTAGAFTAALGSWGTAQGEPNTYFTALLATRDAARGQGSWNASHYANPRLDALVERALATPGDAMRHALWQEATRIALVEDAALLPLYHQVNIWAMRAGLAVEPRRDENMDITELRAS
ncbi:ABC transporter substrate-binding protein [Falsiroseomonas ponticola]|uniref:ABC transporter substrate-binding protein n=1 Tax=Falsiroseomonas ponticola TaxID=2786951 RepID=UPI0019326DD8|nr:ABC transporter substrate-binding protein [Roseomonas ponticola]